MSSKRRSKTRNVMVSSKKRRRQRHESRRWSDMNQDLLHSVLGRLSWVDFDRFGAACASWRAVAKAHRSLPSAFAATPRRPEPPCLLLPSTFLKHPNPYPEEYSKDGRRSLFNLQESRAFQLKKKNVFATCAGVAVGSSHGWVILGKETQEGTVIGQRCLHLYNPVSHSEIKLPHFHEPTTTYKAILSGDPHRSGDANDFWVVLIHGYPRKLAVVKGGSDGAWTSLDAGNKSYEDVVCSENVLLALADDGSVDSWDLRRSTAGGFEKHRTIRAPFPDLDMSEDKGKYAYRMYLINPPGGELLLAVRVIGEFVSADGSAVLEEDIDNGTNNPPVCPYRTMSFKVFRLDSKSEEERVMWVQIESIGDMALFVGGGQSVALNCREVDDNCANRNSLYFTDDYWDRMEEDGEYGGHDLGVFSLDDGKVTPIHGSLQLQWMVPPPIWITPNPS